jgi:hypothetical protein
MLKIAVVVCPVSAVKGGWLKIRKGVSLFIFGVWVIGYVEGNQPQPMSKMGVSNPLLVF